MRVLVLGSLLLGTGPLTGGTSAKEQCTYQFPASRTTLALETQTVAGYGGVVLAPGNVLAVSFSNIAVPEKDVSITGVSLFVIPSFHVSSSALLEVAVAQSSAYTGVLTQGDANQREEEKAYMANFPQNAAGLESRDTVRGWSISKAPSTQQRDVWQPCRYYEVGDIGDDIRDVIYDARFAGSPTEVDVFLRHHSGDVVFIEGNDHTYVNNVVLQIRGDCGWDVSKGSTSLSASSSSGSNSHTYWEYTTGSAGDQDFSTGYYGSAPGRTTENDGPIRTGQRHPLCGGQYLDSCDLGPYRPSDVGDGSCQQHMNTEECHYDGGDCCSASCGLAAASDTPYVCLGSELDPYYCRDPEYAIDLKSAMHSEYSAATTTLQFPWYVWRCPIASHAHGGLARGGSCDAAAGFAGHVLAASVVALVMVFAAGNTATVF